MVALTGEISFIAEISHSCNTMLCYIYLVVNSQGERIAPLVLLACHKRQLNDD